MDHRQIGTPKGTVHYWVSKLKKNAETIVFTHGLTADHTMFKKQIDYFKDQYNLITWDVPLHGLSRPYSDFSYRNCAADLHRILNAEKIKKVALVGMSMGGYPSQSFAELHPECVLGLIALDTTPFGLEYYSKSDIWWLKRTARIAGWYPEKMLKNSMAGSVSRTAYAREQMAKMLAPLSKNVIIEQMDIAYRLFIEENHDVAFNYPLLILLGEHDNTGKVKQYCEKWAKDTGAPLVIIKDAAHFANGDNPEQVNAAIGGFIQGLPR